MHWSRELLTLTAGVRWRIAGLVIIGILIVAASLVSLVCAGRAIAAVFAGDRSSTSGSSSPERPLPPWYAASSYT